MRTLVDDLVPDELWALVAPLLPVPPRPPHGGRHRTIGDRNCFAAIVFMARTSTPWRLLPARELGCGSPATAWRRLDEWAKTGVFEQLHLESPQLFISVHVLCCRNRATWEATSSVKG